MPDKYCPVCENTTYNCECKPDTTCDACENGRATFQTLSECTFCGAKDVAWCKRQVGGCDGCESCCKCTKTCEHCGELLGEKECPLTPGYHGGTIESDDAPICCANSPDYFSHWICTGCGIHYDPRGVDNKCPNCARVSNDCAEYGHEWEVLADEFDPMSNDTIHVHAELRCTECGLLGEICRDLDVEQL